MCVVAGVRAGSAERSKHLALKVFNLLDTEYASIEYNLESDWDPSDGVGPLTPARHITAGAPRSGQLSLGVRL